MGESKRRGALSVNNSLLNIVLHDNPGLRTRADKEAESASAVTVDELRSVDF
jgi:hypothetical protein